jgi:hypothetical protein
MNPPLSCKSIIILPDTIIEVNSILFYKIKKAFEEEYDHRDFKRLVRAPQEASSSRREQQSN